MNEKELRTSSKQRFFIILIAVLMLGSIVASYALIVVNGGKANPTATAETAEISEEKIAEYEAAYNKKTEEFEVATRSDFNEFIKYKSEIKAFNETAANSDDVRARDLKVGSGRELSSDDTDYLAYYVGWCADETIFDSSFNDKDNPTGFSRILDISTGLIEGWYIGAAGMKIGGIREITIPSELAYGDSMEICGGKSKPLKFIIMAKAKEDSLTKLANELEEAYTRLQYAYYGVDYDSMSSAE